ncbi:restriction endonuclease subunit S [Methanogenium organophilum]|uniref:Restriction endonuclease subunit S n=1 Tax=Methanogenium organophilum TaxID=2199 RepID=A0A9X9S297_METOG|nr:restriction endonuclease subunit S [Methanogenium organophilum]WAI00479.1 restriction endonuclease subunit S [Methanogenium organophilum]
MNTILENTEESQSGLCELPDGWIITQVNNIYSIKGGGTPSTKNDEYWDGDIPWITSADIDESHVIVPRKTVSILGIQNSATNLVPKNSIIVVTRVGLGKIALTENELCFSQDCHALICNQNLIYPKYGLYYLAQKVQLFKYHNRGTTISGVTTKQLKELPFFLPPLPEQHRIVEKIEEEFTRLDAGVSALKKAKALIPKYRQSVLKAAMCGDLTEEWRAEHPDVESADALVERIETQYQKTNVHTNNLPDYSLPESWTWIDLANLAWDSGYGTSIKCDSSWEGHPILRIPNISNNKISLDKLKYAPASEDLDESKKLEKGDLLIIRTNGSKDLIGRSAIVMSNFDSPHYFASYLIRYRLIEREIIWHWLGLIWNSNYIRNKIEKMAATTAGQYNINLKKLNSLSFPIPPLPEQHEIVCEIERRFSVIDEMEKAVDDSLVKAERLRQSILKKAFEGRLVPQNPDDEPASVLLERIKAEKEQRAAEEKSWKRDLKKQKTKKKAKTK